MTNLPAAFREFKRLEGLREQAGLSLAELERWTMLKRILAEHFSPDLERGVADQQASLRVPVKLRVEFENRGALRECLMTNVSRGGVFVATDDPLPIGTSIVLRIHVGGASRTVELRGQIVSVNTSADMATAAHGMGVKFSASSDADEALVRELYGKAMNEADVGVR